MPAAVPSTAAASPPSPACTSSGCRGSTPAGRRCWAGSRTTRSTSPSGSPGTPTPRGVRPSGPRRRSSSCAWRNGAARIRSAACRRQHEPGLRTVAAAEAGAGVNLATRVSGQAVGGEVLLSAHTAALAGEFDNVLYESRGRRQLRNVREPVELVAAVSADVKTTRRIAIDLVCQMAVDPEHAAGRLVYDDAAYCPSASWDRRDANGLARKQAARSRPQ